MLTCLRLGYRLAGWTLTREWALVRWAVTRRDLRQAAWQEEAFRHYQESRPHGHP